MAGAVALLTVASFAGPRTASPDAGFEGPARLRAGGGLAPGAARILIAEPGLPVAPQVAMSAKNDTSAPLRSLANIEPLASATGERVGGEPAAEGSEAQLPGRDAGVTADSRDPVTQTGGALSAMPAPALSIRGITNAENGVATGYTFNPPDVNGDAGAGFYVQAVNATFAVYDTGGTRVLGPLGINTVWSGFGGLCETHLDGDPVAVFDELSSRWLLSEFALDDATRTYRECIAVSKTSDPTGQWYRYDFNYPKTGVFGDYPKFGVWQDGYYMSANQFTSSFGWSGSGAIVYERAKMLTGAPARQVYFDLAGQPLANLVDKQLGFPPRVAVRPS